jgi:hypothetical protein
MCITCQPLNRRRITDVANLVTTIDPVLGWPWQRRGALRTAEAELARVEARISFCLILAGHLELACPS